MGQGTMAATWKLSLGVVLPFVLALVQSAYADCPAGYSENVATGKCYKLVTGSFNRDAAAVACSTDTANAFLATIHTASDKDFAKDLCGSTGCWIGFNRKPGVLCQAANAT
jgi:hypothetical protein